MSPMATVEMQFARPTKRWSRIAKPLGMNGMNDALRLQNAVYVERASTMSSVACKQSLLDPTRWCAITYAVATAVNLREEWTTVLVMKAMVVSSLNSACRFFPTHNPQAFRITSTLFS